MTTNGHVVPSMLVNVDYQDKTPDILTVQRSTAGGAVGRGELGPVFVAERGVPAE